MNEWSIGRKKCGRWWWWDGRLADRRFVFRRRLRRSTSMFTSQMLPPARRFQLEPPRVTRHRVDQLAIVVIHSAKSYAARYGSDQPTPASMTRQASEAASTGRRVSGCPIASGTMANGRLPVLIAFARVRPAIFDGSCLPVGAANIAVHFHL
uniref:Uncharacterized protein n=1 Tax=Plectus sambesii TaxID=2011161 RepID=A0A914VCS8_9BILA